MPEDPEVAENAATPAEEAVAPAAAAESSDATLDAPEVSPEAIPEAAAQVAFLTELRARLAASNYGLSASLELSFTPSGLLLLEADDAQEALRAASAAIADAADGREWRFVGNGPDLDTGRSRAVVRITPLPY